MLRELITTSLVVTAEKVVGEGGGEGIFLLTSLKRGGNYVAFFFNTNWKNALKLKKSSNKFGLAHTWPKNDQKLMCTYSLGQNAWHKITKFSKIEQA